jgi:hypothetical protein
MKVVRVLEYGGQLVFDEVPRPTIARDEVLVNPRVLQSIIWIL